MPLGNSSKHAGEVNNRETLSSNKLRWFSVLTYISLTLAILDRDPERSGGDSIYGAVAQNAVFYYALAGLTSLQCSGYLFVGVKKIITLSNTEPAVVRDSNEHARTRKDSFIDVLSEHKYISLFYWGGAVISCFFAILNSIYLIVLPFLQTEQQSFGNTSSPNSTLPSGFNTSLFPDYSVAAFNVSQSANYSNNKPTSTPDGATLALLHELNKAVVLISVWSWNCSNFIEVSYFAYYCLCNDMNNAFISTAQAVSNVARTLVVAKQYEAASYPVFIVSKWLSLPYYSCYLELKAKFDKQQQDKDDDTHVVELNVEQTLTVADKLKLDLMYI